MRGALIGRDADIATITGAMTPAAVLGVVISGPAGVGKSVVADRVAADLAGSDEVWRVQGSAVLGEIPLGVLSTSLPPQLSDDALAPAIAVKRMLAARDSPAIVLVDDAPEIDDASAMVLASAADAGLARLVITRRNGTLLPAAFAQRVQSGSLARIDIEPFDEAATAGLVESLVGGPVDRKSHARIHALTNGLAIFVRELSLAAIDDDLFVADGPAASLSDIPAGSSRLGDLLDQRLRGLDDDERRALQDLAVSEPIAAAEFEAIGDRDTLSGWEDAGLVVSELDRSRLTFRVSHPLFGEMLRKQATPAQRRAAHQRIAEQINALGARRRDDRLRLALWTVEGSITADPATMSEATELSLTAGDIDMACRTGQRLFSAAPSFGSAAMYYRALYRSPDRSPIVSHLADWGRHASSDDELGVLLLADVTLEFWRLGDPTRLDQLADPTHLSLSPQLAALIAAQAGLMLVMNGRVSEGYGLARPMADGPPGRQMLVGALACCHALRSWGRHEEAVELAHDAMRRSSNLGPETEWLSDSLLASALADALVGAGRFDEGERQIERALSIAGDVADPASTGIARSTAGELRLLTDRFDRAEVELTAALDLFTAVDQPALAKLAIASLVMARSLSDNRAGTEAALERLTELEHQPTHLADDRIARARAWVAHRSGREDIARDHFRRAVDDARRCGSVSGEADTWHDMARAGYVDEALEGIDRIPERHDHSDLFAARIDHVRALASGRLELLAASAVRFAELGTPLFASESAATAADVAGADGDAATMRRWLAFAAEQRALTGRSETTAVSSANAQPLTKREREIAALVAEGLTSREVGARLYIGTRTVESHLARMYRKLNVGNRAELTTALFGPEPGAN